jgi:hypothetical protein
MLFLTYMIFFGLQAVRIVVDTVHGVRVDRLLD